MSGLLMALALALLAPHLALAQIPTDGTVKSFQKISATAGSFAATLDNEDRFGKSAAGLGDLDGDGVADLAVGVFTDDDGGTDRGAVYILFMQTDGTVKSFQKISDMEGSFTATLDNYDFFGASLTALGDLDGDGITDLAVGAVYDSDGGSRRGAVYVLFMQTDGTVKSYQKISDTKGNFTATLDNYDYFGNSVANLGDLDGDGITDLAVGAWYDNDGGTYRGAVYVLFMQADGTVKSFQKISNTVGSFTATLDNEDHFGVSVAGLGDLDGDGVADLAVGAHNDDDGGTGRGAVYILFMQTDGIVKSFQKISDTAGNFTALLNDSDYFGSTVAPLGDMDNDGVVDLAVNANGDDDGGSSRGAVYVLFMQTDGTVKSFQKISDTAGSFTATLDDSDEFGVTVAGLGDLDGDGVADLAVGASNDDDGGTDRGAVYILFLKAAGLVAYYPFNGNANDESANSNNGTVYGATLAADRFESSNSAYSFDGINDYISVPTDTSILNTPINQFSFQAWIKSTSGVGTTPQNVFEVHTQATSGEIYFEADMPAPMRFGIIDDGGTVHQVGSQSLELNAWYHVVGTYDGSKQKIYIDGVLHDSLAWSNSFTITSGAELGKDMEGGQYFNGLLDDIRIYNRALSAAEIEELYLEGPPAVPTGLTATPGDGQIELTWSPNSEADLSHYVVYQSTTASFTPTSTDSVGKVLQPDTSFIAMDLSNGTTYYFKVAAVDSAGNYSEPSDEVSATPAGLVAYYPFSGNANDESGNANHGAVYGATLAADRFESANSAYSFDGINDYIYIPTDASIENTPINQFSFQAWIKSTSSTGNPQTVFETHTEAVADSNEVFFEADMPAPMRFGITGNDGADHQVASQSLQLNAWYHIVGTYDSSFQKIYVNGTIQDATGWENNFTITSGAVLGKDLEGTQYFNGLIDDIRIYTRALSAAEIEALYHEDGWDVPPEIVSTAPARNALNVARDAAISVAFNMNMAAASLDDTTFVVHASQTGTVSGTYSYDPGDSTATFTPTSPFKVGELVSVTLTTGVQSAAGDILISPYAWSFTAEVARGSGEFQARTDYGTGSNPQSVFSADLDGDGNPDLATANQGSNTVSVLLNSGDGTFQTKTDYGTGSYPFSVFSADLDGDGDLDLAAANYYSNTVSVLLNNGDGTFQARIDYGTGTYPRSVFFADLDGDGDPDLAAANEYSNTVSVLMNNGDGTFQVKTDYATGSYPFSVFSVDLDGDGDLDLAATNENSGTVSILLNRGDGTFQAKTDYGTGSGPLSVFSADLDGDGNPDLAVANYNSHTVSVLLNNGDGTFQPKSDYGTGNYPYSVFSADLDGDGDRDLATANYGTNDVSVLLNNGNGTFQTKADYGTGSYPWSVFSADLDGDGDLDLATADYGSSTVSVLLNIGGAPPAAGLAAYYPFSGSANDESGNANHGTVEGAALVADRFRNAESAYSFDGLDDYIVVPHSQNLDFTEQISISFWAILQNDPFYLYPYHIIEKPDSWGIGQSTDSVSWSISNSVGSTKALWTHGLELDKQYHFIMNYDGSQMAIYINGNLDASEAFTGSIDTTSNAVYIGNTPDGDNFMGLIDDIRIYDRTLSEAEIEALYHQDGWPLPAVPTGLAAAPDDEQVTLTWSPNAEADLSHYVVYQSTTQGFMPTSADSVGKVLQPDTSFIAMDLTNGTTYYFRVAAVDESDNYSAASEEASATPYDPLRIGLAAYYPFSGNAADSSGNANHGTVNGAALEADRFGKANSAYSFDGVDDVLRIDDFHSWTDSITLSIWTRINAWNTEDNPLFNKHEEFYVKGLGDSTGFYLAGVGIMWVNVVPPRNEWTHVLASYDGTVMKLYVNGMLKGDKNLTGTILDSSYPLYIASDEAGAYHYLNGQVDDARIYSRALSEAEIGVLYHEDGWLGTATEYITGTGEVAFPGTDIVLNFTSQSGTDTIQVAAIDADPGGTLPADVALAADRYWTITHTGSGDFSVDLTFNLGAGAFDADDQSAAGNLKLLRRESNGSGEWAAIRSGATATDSTVTFAGLTTFSQFAIGRWTDIQGPAITDVTSPSSPEKDNPITVTATITDSSVIQSVTLHYAQGASASYSEALMNDQGGNTYSGTIPGNAATAAGVAYFIAAEDNLGNISRSDTASIQVLYQPGTITSNTAGSAFRYGFPFNQWRLISLPSDVDDKSVAGTIREALETAPSDETWELFRYEGPGPDDYAAADSLALGESYFLKQVQSDSDIYFTLGAGQSVDLTGWSMTIPSRTWRFVSSPYPFAVTVDADQGTFIGPYTYGAFGSGGQENWSMEQVQTTFQPWGGYIIYNNTDQTQTLEIKPPGLAKVLLAKGTSDPIGGWLLHLTVEGEQYFDAGNVIGRIPGAVEGLDDYDHPEPPYLDGYVSLVMDRPEWSPNSGMSRFTSDVRTLEETNGAWDLDLRTKGETGPIAITCAIRGEVPPDIQVVLLDLARRQTCDITDGEQPDAVTDYSEQLPYHLKVIAGTPDYVQGAIEEALARLPEEFALSQNYPNPFNPSTTIEYALPLPARVSLRVYNLLGREIAVLVNDWQDMGYYEIIWQGRDRAGRSVATGVYFAVLHADGHVLTRKMVLLK